MPPPKEARHCSESMNLTRYSQLPFFLAEEQDHSHLLGQLHIELPCTQEPKLRAFQLMSAMCSPNEHTILSSR